MNRSRMIFTVIAAFIFGVMLFGGTPAPSVKEPEYLDDLIVKLSWETSEGATLYNIYRGEGEKLEKYAVTNLNEFIDPKIEKSKVYTYKVAAVIGNAESDLSEEVEVSTKFGPRGVLDIYPKKFKLGEKIKVYFSPKKSREIRKARAKIRIDNPMLPIETSKVYIRYGFNEWEPKYLMAEGKEPEMSYDVQSGYWIYELTVPTYIREIDFAFKDDMNNWETNGSKDYKLRAIEGDEGIYFIKK